MVSLKETILNMQVYVATCSDMLYNKHNKYCCVFGGFGMSEEAQGPSDHSCKPERIMILLDAIGRISFNYRICVPIKMPTIE